MLSPVAATIHDGARQTYRRWFLFGADAILWRSGYSYRGPNCARFCVSDDIGQRAFRAAGRRNLAGPPWQVSKRDSFLNLYPRTVETIDFVFLQPACAC